MRPLSYGAPVLAQQMGISESTAQRIARDLRIAGLMPPQAQGCTSPVPLAQWPQLPEDVVRALGEEVPAPRGGDAEPHKREPPQTALPPPFPAMDSEEVQALRRQLSEVRRLHQGYREDQGELRVLFRELADYVQPLPPPPVLYHKPRTTRVQTPIALVVHNTDWHMGAVQDADEIEGFNAFSPDILRQRIGNFAADVIDWTELHRASYDVDACHVLVTGDLISGDIHDELRVTNAFPTPVQAVEAARLLATEVSTLAPHFASVVVEMVTADNHGRLTHKPQHKQGGFNTWNFPAAVLAEALLIQHRNVTFNTYPREQQVVDVKGRRYLMFHGHGIKGWAGFPFYGVQRKVGMEGMKRMRAQFGHFDRAVLGHFHAPLAAPDWWIGGSASGTDAFDHACGRESGPIQVAWFVHPGHREFDRTEWDLREDAA